MDVARIYRFNRAFQKADDVEKKLIVKALNEEGERLGGASGKLDQADAVAMLPSAEANSSTKQLPALDRAGSC